MPQWDGPVLGGSHSFCNFFGPFFNLACFGFVVLYRHCVSAMLKISYFDSGLALEQVAGTVDTLVAHHALVAARLGQTVVVQASRGSVPLPAHLPGLATLAAACGTGPMTLAPCDRQWLELSLPGLWIAQPHSHQGILVVECDPALEGLVLSLWQQAETVLMASRVCL